MAAKSKRAKKIREAAEFTAQAKAIQAPINRNPGSWDIPAIVAAREAQMRGQFSTPAQLAAAMRTDDALSVAFENRIDALRSVGVEMHPANESSKATRIADEADALYGDEGIGCTRATLENIAGDLVNHNVAFAHLEKVPRDDGSRVDIFATHWPIEFVRWNPQERTFQTQIDGGPEVSITHGDGEWIIFSKQEHEPWKHGALLPAALVWARHAFALRDWAKGSAAHGNAKVIGKMPEGMPLQDDAGALTADASAFLDLLKAVASADAPVGIAPANSTVDFLANSSNAWQVWAELIANAERAAARIYLGTDGTLGSKGGAPGVDIETLFGVAATRVEGDLRCIRQCLHTGLLEIWTAINFGDSTLTPKRCYKLADRDAEAAREAEDKRRALFFAAVKAARDTGFVVDQAYVEALSAAYDVTAPKLPEEKTEAPSIALAPTDIARVVTVNEVRASAGLSALMLPDGGADPDGTLTVEAFAAKQAQAAKPEPAPTAPAPTAAPQPVFNNHVHLDMSKAEPELIKCIERKAGEVITAAVTSGRITGPQGPQGPQGDQGEAGRDGVDGKDGRDGRDGVDGEDGVMQLTYAQRTAAFLSDIREWQDLGGEVSDEQYEALAMKHGINPKDFKP